MPLRCNPAGEQSERCPGGAFAVRRKRGERVNRGKQRAEASAMPAAPTEIAECKPEKSGKSAKNEKPGSVGKSTLPGVEVAGFSFAPQSQSSLLALGARSPLVSIDSFASLRLWRRPTGATFGSLTHGLTGRVSESSPRHAKIRNTPRGIPDFCVEVAGFEPAAFWSRIRGFGFLTDQCEFSPFSPGCAMKSPEFPKISGFFMPFLKWTFCLSG